METKTKILVVGFLCAGIWIGILIFRRRSVKLVWPLIGRITSEFGERRTTGTHTGIDIAAKAGTPIQAPADGQVERVFYNSVGGNQLLIRHLGGLQTGYAHLSKTLVKAGQRVKQNQVIGTVGNTGRSTGPHLHFTVTHLGIKQNPRDYLV